MAILGIDTSNYRTSLCVIDRQRHVLSEINPLLAVKAGEVGLQQSQALFQHLQVWPTLLEKLRVGEPIEAVGVSVKPRPVESSYMPVFKVGEVLAKTIAHFLSVPLFETSHQEGHIAAGEYSSSQAPEGSQFIAVHLSGGTSEVLLCQRQPTGYMIEKLGGTLDLHVGQFIDRVGVRLGLSFPAGPELEVLATQYELGKDIEGLSIPSHVRDVDFSFSGPTSAALRLIEKNTYTPAQIARAVENNIAKTLEKSLRNAIATSGVKEILLVGGIAANHYIRDRLKRRLEHPAIGASLCIASPRYATDNAFGVACLALASLKHRKE